MLKWLGEKNAADTLSLSVSNNITSGNGAGAARRRRCTVRPYPEVIDYLQQEKVDNFLDGDQLARLDGGSVARDAIDAYLHKYGMR